MALISLSRGIVVYIPVPFAVADLFHERGDRIAQVQRYSKIAVLTGILDSFLQSNVGRIVFGSRG